MSCMQEHRSPKANRFWLPFLFLAEFACRNPAVSHCTYAGSREIGDTFPSIDGCNTCSCTMGGVVCTERACAPDVGGSDAGDSADTSPDTSNAPDTESIDSPATAGEADAADPSACSLGRLYNFWQDPGPPTQANFFSDVEKSSLKPPHTYVLWSFGVTHALVSEVCDRELPCSDPTGAGVGEIQKALGDPDVVAALAASASTFYGTDTRPNGAAVFVFQRDDGHGFTVGSGTVPAGVRALAELLSGLQTTASATHCAGPN